jgi:hypothetical protein
VLGWYVALSGKDEEEVIMASYEVLLHNLPEGAQENDEKSVRMHSFQ